MIGLLHHPLGGGTWCSFRTSRPLLTTFITEQLLTNLSVLIIKELRPRNVIEHKSFSARCWCNFGIISCLLRTEIFKKNTLYGFKDRRWKAIKVLLEHYRCCWSVDCAWYKSRYFRTFLKINKPYSKLYRLLAIRTKSYCSDYIFCVALRNICIISLKINATI